jgi:DNA-binding response OmpR family regulator
MGHQTPVLILTHTVDVGCCLNALDMGANEYVQKPLTPSEVQELVDDYLKPSMKLTAAHGEPFFYTEDAEPWRRAS